MNCPECKDQQLKRYESVWECIKCGSRWFIIKTSQKEDRIKDDRAAICTTK